MSTFKELTSADFKTTRSFLDQIVDVIQNDISGSESRQQYQHFVTGGIGPGITSSLWQTVYDQDFSLETANPVLDMTVGLFASSSLVNLALRGTDSNGKYLFRSESVMMREKIYMYQQFAQKLLGDADEQFTAPFGSTTTSDKISSALFLSFKRLFARDQIKRETFVMGFYASASSAATNQNLTINSANGFQVFTDIGAATNKEQSFGGQVSSIVDASNTNVTVGLLFNDAGVAVLDFAKILDQTQVMSGSIDAMKSGSLAGFEHGKTRLSGAFVNSFLLSASIDDIVDHVASVRFGSGTLSAINFLNITNINSSIITCRLGADEFNYSSNPTYVDEDNRIVVIDEGQEEFQRSFVMITGIGYYDANDNLLAVGKVSRPIEKNDERDLLLRARMDF